MTFHPGQAFPVGGLPFPDGNGSQNARPYPIVKITESDLYILNVSSIGSRPKFVKSVRYENHSIRTYNPPFVRPSFVKMDSLICVSAEFAKKWRLLAGGKCLNDEDLSEILAEMGKRNLWTPFLKIDAAGVLLQAVNRHLMFRSRNVFPAAIGPTA